MAGESPVYTDDSPQAAQLLASLPDLAASGNQAEQVRVLVQLLGEFGHRLVPADEDPITGDPIYRDVRSVVIGILTEDPVLLDRYRSIMEPRARAHAADGEFVDIWLDAPVTPTAVYAGLQLAESDIRRGRVTAARAVLDELTHMPPFERGARAVDASGQEIPVDTLLRRRDTLNRLLTNLGNLAADGIWQVRSDPSSGEAVPPAAAGSASDTPAGQSGTGSIDNLASPVAVARGWSVGDVAPAPRLDHMLREPAWTYDHPLRLETLVESSRVNRQRREEVRSLKADGTYTNAMPAAQDDLVFVSDSLLVAAVDRFSGDVRWQFSLLEVPDPSDVLAMRTDSWDVYTAQPSGIALWGDYVAAILRPDRIYRNAAGGSVIVCFDRDTGGVRWIIEPSALHPDLREGVFIGIPVIHEGSIYAIVRRHSLRLATDSIVRLDLETGDLVWRRYIVSSGLESRWSVSPPTQPVVLGGDLLYTSPVGATARIDLSFGFVRWLRLGQPADDISRVQRFRPWEYDQPIITEEGLLTFSPDRAALQLLDLTTGWQRAYFSRGAWNNPRYLLALPNTVPGPNHVDTPASGVADAVDRTVIVAVGSRDIEGRILVPMGEASYSANVLWQVELPEESALVGRAQIGRDGSIISGTRTSLRRIHGISGEVVSEAPVADPGVPLVIGDEVLMATADGLASYLPFEVGAPRLIARMEADPLDPRPAINLARLAFRHGRFADVLPAIDRAIDILDARPRLVTDGREHRRLLDMMLAMIRIGVDADDDAGPGAAERGSASGPADEGNTEVVSANPAERRQAARRLGPDLLDRVARLARTPSERVDYQLMRGWYLADIGDPLAAVSAYQQILIDPVLRQQRWREDRRRMPVRLEATRRLAELITEHGMSMYAAFDEEAAAGLAALRGGAPDLAKHAADLIEFASRYPFSEAAVEAAVLAGQALLEADQPGRAIAAWRLGLELGPEAVAGTHTASGGRAAVAGHLIAELVRLGRHDRAWRELVQLEADAASASAAAVGSPSDVAATPVSPLLGDDAVSRLAGLLGDDWRAALIDLADTDRPAPAVDAIATDQPVQRLTADALLIAPEGTAPAQVALVRRIDRVIALGGPDLSPVWDHDFKTPLVELAWAGGDEAVFWTWSEGYHETLTCLRLRDGSLRWTASLGQLLGDSDAISANEATAGDAPGDADAAGAEAAADGRELRQNRRSDPGEITRGTRPRFSPLVTASEIVLVDSRRGRVLCVDRVTGALQWTREIDLGRITHADHDPLGLVIAGDDLSAGEAIDPFSGRIYNGQAQIIVLDPLTGEQVMRLRLTPGQAVQWVEASGLGEAVVASDGMLMCLDLVRLEERWQLQHPDLEQPSWPAIAGRTLLVADIDLQLRPVNLATGVLGEGPGMRVIGRPAATPMLYQVDRDRWAFKTQDDVATIDGAGVLLGRLDRSDDSGVTIRSVAIAHDRMVVVESQGDGGDRTLALYSVDLSGRRLTWTSELTTQIMPRFNAAVVIDGWLLLDAGVEVLAVPMSEGGSAATSDATKAAGDPPSAVG